MTAKLIYVLQDDLDRPTTHTYVLKTCSEEHTEYHHKEVEAYKSLMNLADISKNIVRFYGSWIQHQTYHIILEYVDGGTLTEFFERTKQPSRDEDRIKFWKNLFELAKPVSWMHQPSSSDGQHHYNQGYLDPRWYMRQLCINADGTKDPSRHQTCEHPCLKIYRHI